MEMRYIYKLPHELSIRKTNYLNAVNIILRNQEMPVIIYK